MLKGHRFGIGVCLLTVWAGTAQAQRAHIYLPHTHGATVLSTYIDAEARRFADHRQP